MIFDVIRESHDLQRDLCRKVTASRGDMAARQVLFLQLKVELMAHAAAEERHLYVPLLMNDGGLDASRHALHEHHEIDELLDDLSVRTKKLIDHASLPRRSEAKAGRVAMCNLSKPRQQRPT